MKDHRGKIIIQPRPAVLGFSLAMEKVLRENDRKGGWKHISLTGLMNYLRLEYMEAYDVFLAFENSSSYITLTEEQEKELFRKFVKECIDIANFCMMIYDNFGKAFKDE